MTRAIPCSLIVLLPATATANGAMGLGLEQWDLHYWFVYVLATTIMEAWLIGKWLGMKPAVSIATSITANLFTGLMCGVSGLLAPFLHESWVGGRLNPNPLLNTFIIIVAFAIPSAIFEAYVWQAAAYFAKPRKSPRFLLASLAAHGIGIPLAFVILLIPDRPYVGLEAFTTRYRNNFIAFELRRALELHISDTRRIPDAKNIKQLLSILQIEDPNAKSAFYAPEFHRFDTGETYRVPRWVWNTALAGKKIDEHNDGDQQWLLKRLNGSGRKQIFVDLATGGLN